MNKRTKTKKTFLIKSIVLSITMGIMICIFEPLQLYFTNIEEYWFDIYNLFPVCLKMFAALFGAGLLLFIIARLIGYKFWKIIYIIYGVVFLCTYIQGNYLAGNLPLLDGSVVNWQNYDYQRKYTIILWSAVILITALVGWKRKSEFVVKMYFYISSVVLSVLIVTCLITGMNHNGLLDKGDLTVTTDKFMTMSKEGKNFVILLLDATRGEEMYELLMQDDEIRAKFKDFTYYDDTMGSYPLTNHSLHYVLSGDWYEYDELINDYRTRVLLEAPLFTELQNRDYSMELYTLEMPFVDNEGFYRFDNFKKKQAWFSSEWKLIKLELRLVGLKYAPYDLKRRCLALPDEFDNLKVVEDLEYEVYSPENSFFMQHLKEDMEYIPGNNFKFIHVNGAHVPFRYNRNVELIDGQTNYDEAVAAAANMAGAYIQKLQASGVYDNTVIIVLSDHGYNDEPYENLYYNPYGRQQPILFIKGFNEHHEEMQVSEAPVAQGDLQEAYVKLMDGSYGSDVFPYKEGDQRERRFLWYRSDRSTHFEEYIQTGHASNTETMIRTGKVYDWID